MAAPNRTLTLYRNLLKELRSVYKPKAVQESVAYQYMRKQFRDHNVTSEKFCRSQQEMEYLARTYLCFIQSVKKHEELNTLYKGAGERSVESAANMVGLGLPKLPEDDR